MQPHSKNKVQLDAYFRKVLSESCTPQDPALDLLISRDPDLCLSNPDFPQKLPSGPLIKSYISDLITLETSSLLDTPSPEIPPPHIAVHNGGQSTLKTVRFGLCRPLPRLLSLQPAKEAKKNLRSGRPLTSSFFSGTATLSSGPAALGPVP